jgi:heptosyltransferase-2
VKRPERALVLLKPQYIGDAVMALPLIDAVAAAYRDTVVSCGPVVREVLADREAIVKFAPGAKISGVLPVLRAVKALKDLRVDAAFIVNRSFRSALAVRKAGIPVRFGHSTEGRALLLSHPVPYDAKKFEAECYLDLAREAGIEIPCDRPVIRLSNDERTTGEALLEGATVGVQPGARYPKKQVPLEVLAEAVKGLQAEGRKIALLGGSEEASFAGEFARMLDDAPINLVGKLEIRKSIAALSALKLMVGSDTGLMHLAAAAECPTLTVFGPNPASKWAHNYEPHRHLSAPKGDIRRVSAKQILDQARKFALD